MINFKVTPDEDDHLKELVKASGMSRSEVIRHVIMKTWEHMKAGYFEASDKAGQLFKDGKLSAEALKTIFKDQEDKFENDLNSSVYSKVIENQKKKRTKNSK